MRYVVNRSPIDPFTLVHAGAGVAARVYGLTFWQTLALGIVWDFSVEPALKRDYPCVFPFPSQDEKAHAVIDAAIPAVAWLLTDWYLKRAAR